MVPETSLPIKKERECHKKESDREGEQEYNGTSKIFLNMTSKNGRPELISLLQYMKHTTLNNENITVKDERILDLDRSVSEVKQSEEWEAVKMNILEIGMEKGIERGYL